MALIVQKFGGTSLADIGMIRKVASRIVKTYDRGNDVVVILSAMASITDNLIQLANKVASYPDKREMDVLLATGEQTSVSIVAMMLKQMGYKAQSVLAHQIRLITDSMHGSARILEIGTVSLKKMMQNRVIAVIAGFQGCDRNGNVTTLGRGGSDTTAVAIAAALSADICEIYTDVGGIYTADPNICPKAKKLDKISYNRVFRMASLGAKVLHQQSIRLAKDYNIDIHVRSSFSFEKGTMVVGENSEINKSCNTSIVYDLSYARITLEGIPYSSDIISKILSPIVKSGISIDMLLQNVPVNGRTDFTFMVPKLEFTMALKIEKAVAKSIGALRVIGNLDNAKVSVIGVDINDYVNVATSVFEVLGREGINVVMISTSKTKISCVVEEKKIGLTIRILHTIFGLD